MKTITFHKQALIIVLSILLTSSLIYSQSNIVYDTGTTIDIGTGADICADIITINGTNSGSGTFCNGTVAVEIDSSNLPDKFDISQNYPNPFNPSTTIKFQVPSSGIVSLKVYDVLGKEVATLVNEEKPAGSYEINFNASQLSSGIYFYKIQAGSFIQTKKMILLK